MLISLSFEWDDWISSQTPPNKLQFHKFDFFFLDWHSGGDEYANRLLNDLVKLYGVPNRDY